MVAGSNADTTRAIFKSVSLQYQQNQTRLEANRLMGIRNTEDDHTVALYDSVSGFAFSPTFESGEDAEAFLTYVRTQTSVEPYNIAHAELEDYSVKAQDLYALFEKQTDIADFSEFIEVYEEEALENS